MEENQNKKTIISAHGKLLLSSEYFVLDGATALALPTTKGQTFTFDTSTPNNFISWESFDEQKQLWFEGTFDKTNFQAIQSSDASTSERITQILKAILMG